MGIEKKSTRLKSRRSSEKTEKIVHKVAEVGRQSPPLTRKKRETITLTTELAKELSNIAMNGAEATLDSNKITTAVVSPLKQRPGRRSKTKIESPIASAVIDPSKTTAVPATKLPVKRERKPKLTQSTLSFQPAVTKNTNSQVVNGTGACTSNLNTFACLRNLGSTCYINCIIQVMRYTPGFVASIHRLNKQIDQLESLVRFIRNTFLDQIFESLVTLAVYSLRASTLKTKLPLTITPNL